VSGFGYLNGDSGGGGGGGGDGGSSTAFCFINGVGDGDWWGGWWYVVVVVVVLLYDAFGMLQCCDVCFGTLFYFDLLNHGKKGVQRRGKRSHEQ
jgi:hypothetical protein